MKPDMLESLLMDQALGALPEDVNALLEAYLQHHPAEAARARQLQDTVDLARQARPESSPADLPPLKIDRWQPAQPPLNRRVAFPSLLKWAAALMLGIGIGWALSSGQRSTVENQSPQPIPMANRPIPADAAGAGSSRQTAGFWSVSARVRQYSGSSLSGPPRLHWRSPVRRPTLNSNP